MQITSSAIQASGQVLPDYTCDGENVSPPLTFSEIPEGTKSLVLILEDPDAPNGLFTHWLLYDMSPATLQLMQDQPPLTGKSGTNDFGKQGYGGPCPPTGSHRYYFRLYALDAVLDLPAGAGRSTLASAMAGHEIATAELMGAYARTATK
ncbi:MAG TPA: YbhB/YbcL family Raf kinase inhibitor-like protein [Candidatus Saccharimonadales bacterium]|nr:YbhB/YbcL family Raf kinase inhibitor-like protein [Candidatus Saccharimonadales bacterium]